MRSLAQVQAMHKLNQPAVIVKAREADVNIVQGVLEAARSKFKQTYGGDAPTVAMADNYLPGPPSGGLKAVGDSPAGVFIRHCCALALNVTVVQLSEPSMALCCTECCHQQWHNPVIVAAEL